MSLRKNPKRISTRLTNEQRETIEEKIASGEYESFSDFLRSAIDLAVKISRAVSA